MFTLATTVLLGVCGFTSAGSGPENYVGPLEVVAMEPRGESIPQKYRDLMGEPFALAERYPEDFAYVWYDREAARVVLDVVSERGMELAKDLASEMLALRTVQNSQAILEVVKLGAFGLAVGESFDTSNAFTSYVDDRRNIVVVVSSAPKDDMAEALDRAFSDLVEMEIRPRSESMPQASRVTDASPFKGGARMSFVSMSNGFGCTFGFPWISGSTSMMLTAGHCRPNGGNVYIPGTSMFVGTIASGSRENWEAGEGTKLLPGQTLMRGDVGLITIASPKTSTGKIYVGAPGSSVTRNVGSMWWTVPENGDQYCVGGATVGEQCGYTVQDSRVPWEYSNDAGRIINATISYDDRPGTCTVGGDSGGPVYTVRSDGKVAAKGIHSGGGAGCFEVFTDILLPLDGFPGNPRYL